ncbi:MAG: hypothetical protein OXE92_05710 [Bacteroidetes bacterium]|nr:hypothetical protein [Bacteroidota bacterium]
MRTSSLLFISILAVFIVSTGFFILHQPVPSPSNIEIDALTIPTTTHQGRDLTITNNAPHLLTPAAGIVPVCILPGDASRSEKLEFVDCLAGYECDNWREYRDEKNGNTAMVCYDGL